MWKEVGNRVKQLERLQELQVPNDKHFLVRLDGCCFSTFTKGMTKPFDDRFSESMIQTLEDTILKFSARTGYTQSDEMTLFFAACEQPEQSHMYNGRVSKLCSVLASYVSVRFNHHMRQHVQTEFYSRSEWSERVQKKLEDGVIFDARVMVPEDLEEARLCIAWRHEFDGPRNAISAIAQHHFSAKQLQKVNTKTAIDMLKEKGVNLDDFRPSLLYGTFVKRCQVTKEGVDGQTGEVTMCVRTTTARRSQQAPITTEFLLEKYMTALP